MVKWGPCTCRAKEVRWYITIYITLRYVHVPRTDQHIPRYVHLAIAIEVRAPTLTCVSIYLYEGSTCRYVRLNTLNVLHVHGPCFNAPSFSLFCHNHITEVKKIRTTKERMKNYLCLVEKKRKKHYISDKVDVIVFTLQQGNLLTGGRGWHHLCNVHLGCF